MHLPITPLGTSQTLHMPSPHQGVNPSVMAMVPPPPVPLPHQHSANTPQFDPHNHSTLEVYLADYELASKATHLTVADKLSQSTHYLEKQEKEDWESFPEFHATPPDWTPSKRPCSETTQMHERLMCPLKSWMNSSKKSPN